mgnify:CR=1 FL=1
MICRKCGTSLPDNAIRCGNCGIKVNMVCPECKTLNAFGEKYCQNCGFQLIKTCNVCHSSNSFSAVVCRKCSAPLDNVLSPQETVAPISISSSDNQYSSDMVSPIHSEEDSVYDFDIVNKEESVEEQIEHTVNLQSEEQNTDEGNNQNIQIEYTENVEDSEEYQLDNMSQNQSYENSLDSYNDDSDDNFANDEADNQDFDGSQQILEENILEEEPEQLVEDVPEEYNEENEFDYDIITIQKDIVVNCVNLLKNSIDKHIIALTGGEGCGKSAVLKQTGNILSKNGYVSLNGSCTPLSQITSFGFFQDAFLRLLGFPPYINSSETFRRDFKKSSFSQAFNFLQPQELSLFLNMLYPVQKDNFVNILENKQLMFNILEKVIKSFLINSNLIIVVDNFELLDGASYDFIVYLLKKKFFNNRLKLFVAYQENKLIQSYFDTVADDDGIFETIYVPELSNEGLIDSVKSSIGIKLNEIVPFSYLDEIIKRSGGNALRIEQETAFLFDIEYICVNEGEIYLNEENKPDISPQSLEELIKLRLNVLPAGAKNVLFMAAIMGYRFSSDILCLAVSLSAKKAKQMLEFLKQELFISAVDNYTCEFKSLSVWKLIYKEAKADLLFKENSERLYSVLKSLVLSSNIQKLISCAEALNKKEEFIIWQNTANITAKLGDTNLYVIAQKQCLKILEEQDLPNAENVRSVIYEQIGKLLVEKSPKEAVTYLANVLDSEIKASNVNKIIDIAGYFINSCYSTGNYFGANEAVDSIISAIESTESKVSDIELALIKTRKLNALLNIGNSEQIINLIQEEILPVINSELREKQNDKSYRNILIAAWLVSNVTLAKALVIQGNNGAENVISDIKEFISQNNFKTEFYNIQVSIIDAFNNTMHGNLNISNEILNSVIEKVNICNFDKNLFAEWNLVNILNGVFSGVSEELKSDLFELAAFTNNINSNLIKNIIKLILGWVIEEEGDVVKALNIYNEEITYFAKEKLAIGALLAWTLIVRHNISSGDIDKGLNTATKALEIAQSPKINNFFFIIYLQKYIAQIYLAKGDLIAVKMYLEKALMLAKQHSLEYQMVDLYIEYGKYMEEYMNSKQTYSEEYIKLTKDMYNKAVILAKELKLSNLIDKASKERSSFRTYCQLNSIEI